VAWFACGRRPPVPVMVLRSVEVRRKVLPIYLLLIFLIPFEVQPLLARSFMGFTVIKWVGLFAVFAAFLHTARTQRGAQLAQSKQGKMFILLLLLVLISWFMGGYRSFTQPLQMFISFAVFFFVTLSMVSSVERARLVMWTVAFSMLLASVDVITDYMWLYRVHGISARPGGLFRDPNYYALSTIISMPIVYYLLRTTTRSFLRLGLYGILSFYCVGLVLSLSRGAFVGLAGMILTAFILSQRKSKAFITIAVIIVLGLQLAPDRLWERFSQTRVVEEETVYGTAASTTRRWHLVKAGLGMMAEHPLKGVGLGQFKAWSLFYEPALGYAGVAHNTYIEVGAELGLPALLLFLGIIWHTYRDLLRMRRKYKYERDRDLWLLFTSLTVSLTGFVIGGSFISGENTKLFWLVVFLTIALRRCVLMENRLEVKDTKVERVSASYRKAAL